MHLRPRWFMFVVCVAVLGTSGAFASGSGVPDHRDLRHGHDHSYPDRGAVVRDVPRGAIAVNYAGVAYRFHDGVWYEPRGPAFIVVAPAIGLVVPTLPSFATDLTVGQEAYLYANETYYRPRPDLGGYEVVNAPVEETAAVVGGALPAGGSGPSDDAVVHPLVPDGTGAPASMEDSGTAMAPAPPAPEQSAGVGQPGSPVMRDMVATANVPAPVVASSAPQTYFAPGIAVGTSSRIVGTSVFTYPRNGQSPEQQARDQYECYRFAVSQTGYDPLRSRGAASSARTADPHADYRRAQEACFDGLGYTVR